MAWYVEIYFQERGTKKETKSEVEFKTRDEANAALAKMESEVQRAGDDDLIILESASNRVSFIKRDFRRTRLYEYGGPIAFTVQPRGYNDPSDY